MKRPEQPGKGQLDRGRWMGLDVGKRFIGVALADPLGIAVRPLFRLGRQGLAEDVERLASLIAEHGASHLVVGRPRHLDGRLSRLFEVIEPLAVRAAERSGVTLHWAEERLSSKAAEELMAQQGVPLRDRRRRRDEFAAALILQWYLEDQASLEGPARQEAKNGIG